MRISTGLVLMLLGGFVMSTDSASAQFKYPETKTGEQVDDFHGTKVKDPYRWLEDDVRKSKDVAKWVEEQNKLTFGYLKAIPARQRIEDRLTQLWNFEKFGSPTKHGDRYYFMKNTGLQSQFVMYSQEKLDSPPEVFVDPNTWSKDGTNAMDGTAFSDDGRYLAYGIQVSGSDWRTWKVMETATKKVLDDELKWVKFSGATWTKDSKGFFYGRFPEPEEGAAFQNLNKNQKVYYHRVGTPQSADVLVYERPDHPDWGFQLDVTEDGRYLIITVWKGTDDKYRVFYRDLTEPYALPLPLIDTFEQDYTFIGNDGPNFFFRTDLEASRGRVISLDCRQGTDAEAIEIIPQSEETLRGVGIVANMFVASYLKDARSQVKLFNLKGELVREVEFPGIGSASGFGGRQRDTETFYSFSSFNTPTSIYRYDMITGKSELFRSAKVDFDPNAYVVKQVFYESKDGTRVPMFVSHKKGLELNGQNPTLLYGYGGFNIPLTPRFSISRLAWMEMGGVFAVANLRGGGEYGETWHKAGTKLKKQNVFNDFIAAAEWLISEKYTRSDRLAIQGGSNGGLLVGACLTQRPDLYGACLPAVGVMDMLRFHQFTAGKYWVDDYGSADNPEEFKALLAYSPYHNIKPGTKYPPTLVTTADTDDRVVPGHSFKFAAALQKAQAGKSPTMIRIEAKAGHGSGKPTKMVIEEAADLWAFLVQNLKFELPSGF